MILYNNGNNDKYQPIKRSKTSTLQKGLYLFSIRESIKWTLLISLVCRSNYYPQLLSSSTDGQTRYLRGLDILGLGYEVLGIFCCGLELLVYADTKSMK